MPDEAPKYTIRDDYDPDDEMPTDTDPLEAYQTYVDDRDAGNGDMGSDGYLPKEQGYRLFQTVAPKPMGSDRKSTGDLAVTVAEVVGSVEGDQLSFL
jgi:hypothetical protein